MRRRALLFLLALVALAAAAPVMAGSIEENRAAANAEADALIAAAALPADATALPGEPEGDGGTLASIPFRGANPNVALRTAWYRSSLSPADVLAFTDAHMPDGARRGFSGGGETRDGHRAEAHAYQRPAIRGATRERYLIVSVSKLDDGTTGIRVDASVTWLEPRPADEVIPSTARHLTISTRGRHTIRVADAARVERIARMLNNTEIYQPDLLLCERAPAGIAQPRLTFRANRSGRPLAIIRVHPAGCAAAEVLIGGRQMPALDLRSEPGPQLLKTLKKLGAY
jgi:hypothetical protein